jgi:hypothetical protein
MSSLAQYVDDVGADICVILRAPYAFDFAKVGNYSAPPNMSPHKLGVKLMAPTGTTTMSPMGQKYNQLQNG